MKKRYLLMYICISASLLGAEKKESAWTKPPQIDGYSRLETQNQPHKERETSKVNQKSPQTIVLPQHEPQSKIDFLKEMVICLMDEQKKREEERIAFLQLHHEYMSLSEATIMGLSNTVKEQKATIEQLKSQQPSIVVHQKEIIALKATVQTQKAIINQLKLQQPLTTHNESKSKLQRRLTT